MRLARMGILEQADKFHGLPGYYLRIYNRRFRAKPAETLDLHRPSLGCQDLEDIFCLKNQRVLRNDFPVAYQSTVYQIEEAIRGKKVVLEERLNGTIHITYKGQKLRYHKIMTRPIRVKQPIDKKKKSLIYKLPTDRPRSLPTLPNYKKWLQTLNK